MYQNRVNVDDLIENETNNRDTNDLSRILDAADDRENLDNQNLKLCGKDLNLNKSQFVTLILLSIYFLLTSCYYSLFAPFFPGEALNKGISQTQVGFIFGIFQFVLLILSPIFGKYMSTIGIRFLFVSGIFLSSGGEILFGFLNLCPDGMIYFIMCVLCRIVTAIGSSMGLSYAIVGYYFPNKISSIVAMLEVFNGLGLMFGPPLGGFLYSTGGFQLPFFVMGGSLFLVFIVSFFIFPYVETRQSVETENRRSGRLLPLLKTPKFITTLFMLLLGSLSIGFLEPSIQLHLAPLGLTPTQLGLILFIPSLLYIIVTPIVGHLCDNFPRVSKWFMFLSGVSSGISFAFLGPVPFLNLPLKLWIFLAGFIAFGISIGGIIIPVYSELVKIACDIGYQNDLKTQGLISGSFSAVWSLGALIGPIVGGVVVDNIGFKMASFCVTALILVVSLFYGIFCIFDNLFCNNNSIRDSRQRLENDYVINNETRPLLLDD